MKVKGIIPIFFITVLKRDPRGEGERKEGIVMPPITFQPFSLHPHPTTLNLILSLSDEVHFSWILLPSTVNDLNLLPSGEKRTAGQRWREEWLIIEKWEPRACRAPNLFYVILRGNLHPVALALGMMNEPEFVLDYT